MRKMLFDHIKQYWGIYLTLSCVLIAGMVFGALGVGALEAKKAEELSTFFTKLLGEQPTSIDPAFLQQIAKDNFIIMAGIWILGLTVIGCPLIYLIVFTRGFILGFTIVFIIQVKKILGFGLVLFTIIFPSFLFIPCLLLGAGLATIFSFLLLQGKASGELLRKDFFYYCAVYLLISLGTVAAGVLQGYFSIIGVGFLGF